MVTSKACNDAPTPRISEQILIRSEQTLAVHKVNEVPVVEQIRGADVEVRGVVCGCGGACELEAVREGWVHGGVLGGVKSVGEGGAMANPDGVAA